MKMRFLTTKLLVALIISSSLCATSKIPQGYKQIECTLVQKASKKDTFSHPHIPGPKSTDSRAPRGQVTSTNWSGYAAANNFNSPATNSVSAVSASWIVPTIKAATGNDYCAIWVGIDGYSSPTVEQIGTEHDFISGVQQNSAWFEMYPGGSYGISGFPLNPGDVISASVVYSGSSIFTLTLTNDTQKVVYTVPTSYTRSTTAKRNSAEWIVEAPYYNGILPLADFVTAYLWGCIATINGVTAPMNNSSWQCVPIEMVTSGGAAKAIPSAPLPDNGSFFETWYHV